MVDYTLYVYVEPISNNKHGNISIYDTILIAEIKTIWYPCEIIPIYTFSDLVECLNEGNEILDRGIPGSEWENISSVYIGTVFVNTNQFSIDAVMVHD